MIVVSGTKRSGTSMWMQMLAAAGVPVLGQQFPRRFPETLRQLNPEGFYESILRQGIYYRTNPHPRTGHYFTHEDVAGYAVKVFVPGVVRTERAFLDVVVANLRPVGEYVASIERLYAIEDEARPTGAPVPLRFPPAYEWWMENFALIRDAGLRRYRLRLRTYAQVVGDPTAALRDVLGAGASAEGIEKGAAAVIPEHHTKRGGSVPDVDPVHAQLFEDLYGEIEQGSLSPGLLKRLNQANHDLLPRLFELQTTVARDQLSRPGTGAAPEAVEGLPDLPDPGIGP